MTLTYHVTVNIDARAFAFVVTGQPPVVAVARLLKDQARAKLRVLSRSATPAEVAEARCPDNRYSSARAALRNYLAWRTMLAGRHTRVSPIQLPAGPVRCNIPGTTWSARLSTRAGTTSSALAATQLFLS
jgi:hypothetical protein